jgi:hypothetical protein
VREGALAVIAAFVVMTGIAALSLHLLDAGSLGPPVAMTARQQVGDAGTAGRLVRRSLGPAATLGSLIVGAPGKLFGR